MRWTLIGLSLIFVLAWPPLCSQWSLPFAAEGQATQNAPTPSQGEPPAQGVTEQEILIGMSAAFKGASRSLGSELYRG